MNLLKECIKLLLEKEDIVSVTQPNYKGYCYYVNKNELLVWDCNGLQNYIMGKKFLTLLKNNVAIDKNYKIVQSDEKQNEKFFSKYLSHNLGYDDVLKTLKQHSKEIKKHFIMYAQIKDHDIKKLVINTDKKEDMLFLLTSFFDITPNSKQIKENERLWNNMYYDNNVVKKLISHDNEELMKYTYRNKHHNKVQYFMEQTTQKMLLELKETFDSLFSSLDSKIRYSVDDIQSIIVQLGMKLLRK